MERVPFFGSETAPFTFYSPSHWVSLVIIAAVSAFTLGWRGLRERPRLADVIRHALAAMLLLLDIALHIWYFVADQWDPAYTLPLHLCSLTLILSFIMLWTRSYRLFEFNYFAGIGGALQALLTPAAILSGYPHFTFFYFFIAHGGIIVSAAARDATRLPAECGGPKRRLNGCFRVRPTARQSGWHCFRSSAPDTRA